MHFIFRFITALLASLFILSHAVYADDQESSRQLLQMAEYISADYAGAVQNNQVINADEYQEMSEFAATLVDKTRQLQQGSDVFSLALSLQDAIKAKYNPADLAPIIQQLRTELLKSIPKLSFSGHLLTREATQTLFEQNCAACHGQKGKGNGPLAASLNPFPTDFTDKQRAENRSILGLYDTISNGIKGTAMPVFSELSDQQRWSLAFYVGSLAFADLVTDDHTPTNSIGVQQFISNSPNTLLHEYPSVSLADIAQLRTQPALLMNKPDPLLLSRERLRQSYQNYLVGNQAKAQTLAVSAYLDGFELAENALDAYDPALRKQIEANMMAFRKLTHETRQQTQLKAMLVTLEQQLEQAQHTVNADSLTNTTLFTASFIILLREGLEALLVVIALVTVLIKTERRDTVRYVHYGWITALIAGLVTWWAARHLITISGASREVMEGFASLLAAVVLFYVGFWMHSKTSAQQWQAYIRNHIHKHLSTGTLWGIAGLAFIAVYREVFETVLFYESLLTQALPSQNTTIIAGLLTGVLALALITWFMIRFSLRLPIGKFFSFTTYLMLVLAFVLIGKAIAALQEAAIVPASPMPMHLSISWLGIHPTWEGISSQLLIVLLSVLLLRGVGNWQQGNKA